MSLLRLLEKKRHGETHTKEEIMALILGSTNGELADYQLAAWLMAACLNGLNLDEACWLTEAYVESGKILDLSGIDGVVVDKHSTGGVGDKTTLVLVPLLAAAGAKVAKLSGRGLGFTGGTIDKLEAIPGFQVALSEAAFLKQLQTVGAAISSQTADLAPADGKVYALRDVTATVDDMALIAASVVSKKIAAGAQVIVLDIKYGPGAFMKTFEEADELAHWCRDIGETLGRELKTVLSPMYEPLGFAVGNALEVKEAIDTLKGEGPEDVDSLCMELASTALVSAGLFPSIEDAVNHCRALMENGQALEKFVELVKAQGGDATSIMKPERLPKAKTLITLKASGAGKVIGIDPLKIAKAVQYLGGGRFKKEDTIRPGVGVVLRVKTGDTVEAGQELAALHCDGVGEADAHREVIEAITVDPAAL